MKILKKLSCLLILPMFWCVFSGFQNVNYGVINQSSSGYTEFISIKFDCEDFGTDFANNLQNWKNQIENNIKIDFQNKISQGDISEEDKTLYLNSITTKSSVSGDSLIFNITYKSFDSLCFMCDVSSDEIVKENKYSFLTYDVTTTMPILVSQANGKYTFENIINVLKENIKNTYGEQASSQLNAENLTYSFSYLSEYHRLHSNSDLVVYNDGYYQHTWNNLNPATDTFTIYYTISNKVVWYVGALILGFVFAISYLTVKKLKK